MEPGQFQHWYQRLTDDDKVELMSAFFADMVAGEPQFPRAAILAAARAIVFADAYDELKRQVADHTIDPDLARLVWFTYYDRPERQAVSTYEVH